MENQNRMENKNKVAVNAILDEDFVESRHPEFYKLCKSLIQMYGDIPDQRVSLIGLEETYNIVFAEDKKVSRWNYWKQLREEFMTLESSIYVGNFYDNNLYTYMAKNRCDSDYEHIINDVTIAPYSTDRRDTPVGCSNCGEEEYIPSEGVCRYCEATESEQDINDDDYEEKEPSYDPLTEDQMNYIKSWNDLHPEAPIFKKLFKEIQKDEPEAPKKSALFKNLIGHFCATYPTISYVLIKYGLHYPFAVAGDHPVLVKEILVLKNPKQEVKKGKKDVKKKNKRSHSLVELSDGYECYAHEWVSFSRSRATIQILLSNTIEVPKILIKDAKRCKNVELLRKLYKKDFKSVKDYMIKTIIKMNVQDLITDVDVDYIDMAISYANLSLFEKLVSNPDIVETAKKQNKNITAFLAKGLYHVKDTEDTDQGVRLIELVSKYFTIQRFFTRREILDIDYNSGREEEKEDNGDDLIARAFGTYSRAIVESLIAIPTMDIVTLIDNKLSPLLDAIRYFSPLDGEDEEERILSLVALNRVMGMYKFDPKDLLVEAVRIGGAEIFDFIEKRYDYDAESLTNALLHKKRNNSSALESKIWSLIQKKMSIIPSGRPIVFERKDNVY